MINKEFEAVIAKLLVQQAKGLITEQEFWDEVRYAKAKYGTTANV